MDDRQLDELEIVATFPDLAMRTCSPNFYAENVPVHYLKNALAASAETARLLDALKKSLFYNRPIAPDVFAELSSVIVPTAPDSTLRRTTPAARDIMHGIIGIITEAGELAELLLTVLEGAELDETNLHEELGDVLWYFAPIFKHTGSSFPAEMVRVIRKLMQRFPDKFTNDAANVRDLDAERAVLEGKQKA